MTRLHRIALGGLAGFVVLVVLQHPLRPDLPPAEHFVSEYANGPRGTVQVVAFLAWATGLGATALLARARFAGQGRPAARGVAVAGLAVAAAGAVLTACFATATVAGERVPGVPYTGEARLHDVGSLLVFVGLLAAAVASARLVRRRSYRLAIAGLALAIPTAPAALVIASHDAPGWGQRGIIAVGCAWQLLFVRAARRGI